MSDMSVTKVRLVADSETIQEVATALEKALTRTGWQVIEFSRAYPCMPPDSGMNRLYLTAVRNQENGNE